MVDVIDNVQAIIDAARLGQAPTVLEDQPHYKLIYSVAGNHISTHDIEKWNKTPHRKRGTVMVFDVISFLDVLKDNRDAGFLTVYTNPDPAHPAIVGILNSSGPKGPGWGDFRVSIVFRTTPQWQKWQEIDGKLLPQDKFAEFIENNLVDVLDPPSADVMELVTYLEVTQSVDFKSAIRLSDGNVQLVNNESMDSTVGASKAAVPTEFTLQLAPFIGGPAYKVSARFRHRLSGGKLTMGLKLQRVEDVIADIISQMVGEIVLPEGQEWTKVQGIAP